MKDWLDILDMTILTKIANIVHKERLIYNIFPSAIDMLNAFYYTEWENVKVVILGQDPYPTKGNAHGLSFSVPSTQPIPKSLINIYKELESDLGIMRPNGCLKDWATQGVLLLNTIDRKSVV